MALKSAEVVNGPATVTPLSVPRRLRGRLACVPFVCASAFLALAAAVPGLETSVFAQDEEYRRTERSLADLMEVEDGPGRFVPEISRSDVDEERASRAGIRKIAGKRLTLYTDLPHDPQIEELTEVFDQAFLIWCAYFSIEPERHPDWRMSGFLMKDGDRFRRAGLLPRHLPPFPNGFCVNYDLWIYEQDTPYYRRHLLLHEGTHGFMNTILKSCGPPWYMEGTAELFGTHAWRAGQLRMGVMPKSRDDVPGWGRVRKIQDLVAEGRALGIDNVLNYSVGAHRRNEAYAWSWAAAAFLDFHPRYRAPFRRMGDSVGARDFTATFRSRIGDDWEHLVEQWQLFVGNIEYGYDVARMAIDFSAGRPVEPGWNLVRVSAERGWQNTGIRLDGGTVYDLRARGRYQIDDEPEVWWCEPGGVTIRYYRGRPLGELHATVRPDEPEGDVTVFLQPEPIGLAGRLQPESSGTLYLRINDSAAELADNAGSLDVAIRAEKGNESAGEGQP